MVRSRTQNGTVDRKGPYLYELYFHRTNFIFVTQTLFSSYKLYFQRTNFIFVTQTLFSSYKLYFQRTNFIFILQTLCSSYKLYYKRTNFIISVQTIFIVQTYHLNYSLLIFDSRKIQPASLNLRLIRRDSIARNFIFQLHYATDRVHNEPLGLFCVFWTSTRVQ